MFGEYMVYVNAKPVLLVCDDTVYVKILDVVSNDLADASKGIPYKGSKEHYILDIDDSDLAVNYPLRQAKLEYANHRLRPLQVSC